MGIYKYFNLTIDTDTITRDDMPNDMLAEIFELCGADVALSLITNMQGNIIQVPTRGLEKFEKKLILKEYNGTTASIRKLARTLVVSETYIRGILSQNRIEAPVEGQMSFDLSR